MVGRQEEWIKKIPKHIYEYQDDNRVHHNIQTKGVEVSCFTHDQRELRFLQLTDFSCMKLRDMWSKLVEGRLDIGELTLSPETKLLSTMFVGLSEDISSALIQSFPGMQMPTAETVLGLMETNPGLMSRLEILTEVPDFQRYSIKIYVQLKMQGLEKLFQLWHSPATENNWHARRWIHYIMAETTDKRVVVEKLLKLSQDFYINFGAEEEEIQTVLRFLNNPEELQKYYVARYLSQWKKTWKNEFRDKGVKGETLAWWIGRGVPLGAIDNEYGTLNFLEEKRAEERMTVHEAGYARTIGKRVWLDLRKYIMNTEDIKRFLNREGQVREEEGRGTVTVGRKGQGERSL